MANSSFGLSGFPTAPTNISSGSGGTSPISPMTVNVTSNSGFSNGDLVYLKNGDLSVVPNGAATTAAFNNTVSLPFEANGTGQISAFATPGGNIRAVTADVLSNGNIVVVFIVPNGTPTFRIVDSTNATVLGNTTVSSSFNNTTMQKITVASLKTGGFVIAWHGLNNRLSYRIYDNNGTAVTAAAQDTTFTLQASINTDVAVASTANGNWLFAGGQTGTTDYYYCIKSNTGATVLGWTAFGNTGSTNGQGLFPIAGRSLTSQFCIARRDSAGTTIFYQVLNATGGSLASSSFSPPASGGGVSVTCLDNDTFVIGYSGYYYRQLPVGNVLGSEITTVASGGGNVGFVKALSGNKIFTYYEAQLSAVGFASSANYQAWNVYDVTNTKISASTDNTLYGSSLNSGLEPLYRCAILETSTSINLYWSTASEQGAYPTTNVADGIKYARIDKTTYQIINNGSITSTLGTVNASVNTYARGGSTPNTAAFFSSSTQTVSSTIPAAISATTLVAATNAESVACTGVAITTLQDGRYALFYVITGGTAKMAIYTAAGVYSQTVTVATGASTTGNRCRIITLTNGKVVTFHWNSSSNYVITAFSTSLVQLATITNTSPSTDTTGYYNADAVPLYTDSGAYFLFGYANGITSLEYIVYSDALASSSSGTIATGVGPYYALSLASAPNGSWNAVYYASGATQYTMTGFQYLGGISYAKCTDSTSLTSTGYYGGGRAIAAGADAQYFLISPSSSQPAGRIRRVNGTSVTPVNLNGSSGNGQIQFALSRTGQGSVCCLDLVNKRLIVMASSTAAIVDNVITIDSASTSNANYFAMTPSYGQAVAVAYMQSGTNYPRFTILNGLPYTTALSLVAESSVSNPALALSPANGYYLTGVATSDCAAGGTGTVIVQGSAILSSSYPSGTTYQSFDFTNPTLFGVKGTIVGRDVTIQGST